MQNYTSRQTQMTKLWHFSNLTAYFSGDLEKNRLTYTKHITTPLLPIAIGTLNLLMLRLNGKLRFPCCLGPRN